MRLQNKNFTFNIESGDKPVSRLLTSNLVIDEKLTDILLSDLFYSSRKENRNTIKGFSILQFIKDNKIQINERVYTFTFVGDKDNFVLSSATDPTDFTYNDKTMSDAERVALEKRIQDSAPAIQQQEQPPVAENITTEITTRTDASGAILFDNEDYNTEKRTNPEFTEYNTSPESNIKLLVNETQLPETTDDVEEKLVLIEIKNTEDFAIMLREEYKITLNEQDKTFTYEKIAVEAE